jgi:hypothetical protein
VAEHVYYIFSKRIECSYSLLRLLKCGSSY